MGYTHYYRRHRDIPVPADAYGRFAMDAKQIVAIAESHGIRLAGWDGGDESPWPEFTEGYVRLNGWQEESCETFIWEAEVPENYEWQDAEEPHFSFVKTRQFPYDVVVCALLLRAKHYYGDHVEISSDGSWDAGEEWGDWADGRRLYFEAFGEEAPRPWGRIPA